MKKLLILISILYSTSIFASPKSNIQLDMEVSVNEQHISSPKIIVTNGEMATIKQESKNNLFELEVIATEEVMDDINGVLMKFKITYNEKDRDKSKTIISKPTIFSSYGQEAMITIYSPDNNEDEGFDLKVIATKK